MGIAWGCRSQDCLLPATAHRWPKAHQSDSPSLELESEGECKKVKKLEWSHPKAAQGKDSPKVTSMKNSRPSFFLDMTKK